MRKKSTEESGLEFIIEIPHNMEIDGFKVKKGLLLKAILDTTTNGFWVHDKGIAGFVNKSEVNRICLVEDYEEGD